MATVEAYETSRGERRYLVRYRTPENRQTKKRGFKRKRDAQAWAEELETRKRRGAYVSQSAGRTTVGELATTWATTRPRMVRPKTWETEATLLRTRVLPRWAHVPCARVTPAAVQAWAGDLTAAGLSASTVRACVAVLSHLLTAAVQSRALTVNPCDGLTLPKRATHTPRTYLDARQVARLAAACGPWGPVVLTLAWTGLRVGELAALRVSDVDTARRRLRVTRTASEVGGRIIEGPPKTTAGVRSVPYPAFLAPVIESQVAGRSPDDYAFTSPEGRQVRAGNLRNRALTPAAALVGTAVTALQTLLDAPTTGTLDAGTLTALQARLGASEGLPGAESGPVVTAPVWVALGVPETDPLTGVVLWAGDRDFTRPTVHDLRHTYASLAISAGANVKAVQTALGHTSAAMTLDTYADLFPDDLDAVAGALDGLGATVTAERSVPKTCPRAAPAG